MSARVATNRTDSGSVLVARRLTPALGARIDGVDLACDMTERVFGAVYDAFLAYQVLLFPPQDVPPARQVAGAAAGLPYGIRRTSPHKSSPHCSSAPTQTRRWWAT